MELDAEQTARSLRQVDAEFAVAPGLQVTDNLRWRLLKGRFLIDLEPAVGDRDAGGPRIVVPYLEYKGLLVRRPVLGGVFVVAPDGAIEDLEPEEAARRPELAESGRIFSDTQARRMQDAYEYKGGIWNAWFVHEDQTQITDTETNPQPYLIDFGAELGPQWVTVAEPYGRAFAASAVFLTDATTGRTRIWRVPRTTSLSGNRRALQAVRAVSIPGVDFGDGTPGSGNFRVVEPRPVFVATASCTSRRSSPTAPTRSPRPVVVDAETNKLVAIFDNDRDPQAEEKTLRYIATGEVPDDEAAASEPVEEEEPGVRRRAGRTRAGIRRGAAPQRCAPPPASCCARSRRSATRSRGGAVIGARRLRRRGARARRRQRDLRARPARRSLSVHAAPRGRRRRDGGGPHAGAARRPRRRGVELAAGSGLLALRVTDGRSDVADRFWAGPLPRWPARAHPGPGGGPARQCSRTLTSSPFRAGRSRWSGRTAGYRLRAVLRPPGAPSRQLPLPAGADVTHLTTTGGVAAVAVPRLREVQLMALDTGAVAGRRPLGPFADMDIISLGVAANGDVALTVEAAAPTSSAGPAGAPEPRIVLSGDNFGHVRTPNGRIALTVPARDGDGERVLVLDVTGPEPRELFRGRWPPPCGRSTSTGRTSPGRATAANSSRPPPPARPARPCRPVRACTPRPRSPATSTGDATGRCASGSAVSPHLGRAAGAPMACTSVGSVWRAPRGPCGSAGAARSAFPSRAGCARASRAACSGSSLSWSTRADAPGRRSPTSCTGRGWIT